jgi:hypothetical protein
MSQLAEEEWAHVQLHTCAANTPGGLVRLPPEGLILTLRTLVGSVDNIVASHALLSPEPETIWRIWAFTAGSIAFVEAKYQADNYDFGEDQERRQGNGVGRPAEPTAITAWVRPVRTVTAFEIADVRHVWGNRGVARGTSEFYPTVIKIVFADGASTVVEVGRALDSESKRQRWEALVTAARQAAI